MNALIHLTWPQLLALAGTIVGLVSNCWIALVKNHRELRQSLATAPNGRLKRILFWLPYSLMVMSWAILVAFALRSEEVSYHQIQRIWADGSSVSVNNVLEIYSGAEHFSIDVEGVFYGPELDRLRGRPVFAVVSDSAPSARRLLWVQTAERATLQPDGRYRARAFLGGRLSFSAKEGDIFAVRILVPKSVLPRFSQAAVYDGEDKLPEGFLSEPVYVRTLRSRPAP